MRRKLEPPRALMPRFPPPWPNQPRQHVEAHPSFEFRFIVGTSARQIFLDGHSYPCRLIELVAPDADFSVANTQSIFYATGPSPNVLAGAFELPPGSSKDVHVNDVARLWLIAQNDTDIILGTVET